MKLAITGKGGVGKTTLTALLAQTYADLGRQVLAVDADPSPCLAGALGFPPELRAQLSPIAEMDALIEERTGAKPGGVEHLGRATVDFVDAMLVVVEPTRRSLGTAAQIKKLANDIKLDCLYLVGNKVRNEEEAKFLEQESPDLPVIGTLPADLKVQEADRLGIPVHDHVESLKIAARQITQKINDL